MIKQLDMDFALPKLCLGKFWGKEAALSMAIKPPEQRFGRGEDYEKAVLNPGSERPSWLRTGHQGAARLVGGACAAAADRLVFLKKCRSTE